MAEKTTVALLGFSEERADGLAIRHERAQRHGRAVPQPHAAAWIAEGLADAGALPLQTEQSAGGAFAA